MRTLKSCRSTLLLLLLVLCGACREDEVVSFVTDTETGGKPSQTTVQGLYILCEGNMGANKCSLDYLDLSEGQTSSHYLRNIYGDRNPDTVLSLGDVGNDIAIHDGRLWMVINCSNKVEVCEATTARRIGQVDVPNCRYLAFDEHFAYVSSYVGPVKVDERAPLGRVYKIDCATLQKVDSLTVGYQPEEMAISHGRLYVANSGGYRVPAYDNRVSVINLTDFSLIGHIEVAPNLHRLLADRHGQLWVSSRGDYFGTPSALHCLRLDARGEVLGVEHLDTPVSAMSLVGDSLFCLAADFSYQTGKRLLSYTLIDVAQRQELTTSLFDAPELQGVALPYGIIVNPHDRDFYVMDAHNCVSSGELLHFLPDGRFDWRVWTGDIPSRGAFLEFNDNSTNKKEQ